MKNINNNCGVYSIRNTINGKMYIGSTCNSFTKRWQHHKNYLEETSIIACIYSLHIINMEKII